MFRFILWQSMLRSVAIPFSCVGGAHVLYLTLAQSAIVAYCYILFQPIRLFRKLKQCILLMVFHHFISKLFIGQQELFDYVL